MKTDAMKRFLIHFILAKSKYNDPSVIQAVEDFKLNGLSGLDAAFKNGIKHRNTVYRAASHYDKIVSMVEEVAPVMGFNWLYALNCNDPQSSYFKVIPSGQSEWVSLCDGEPVDRKKIKLFIKSQDGFIPL